MLKDLTKYAKQISPRIHSARQEGKSASSFSLGSGKNVCRSVMKNFMAKKEFIKDVTSGEAGELVIVEGNEKM